MKRHFILFHFILSTGFAAGLPRHKANPIILFFLREKLFINRKNLQARIGIPTLPATPTGACPVRIIWPYSGKKDSGTI